jgi:hypothetical protein
MFDMPSNVEDVELQFKAMLDSLGIQPEVREEMNLMTLEAKWAFVKQYGQVEQMVCYTCISPNEFSF